MLNKLLLPNKCKRIGWCLLIPVTILGVILCVTDFDVYPVNAKVFAILSSERFGKTQWFGFIKTDITNTVVGVLFIVGALLVGFSKEKRRMSL